MRLTEERDNILKSLEERNCELTKAFENYREIGKNEKWPIINDEEELDPEDQATLVKIYYNHREALETIQECANNLKKEIMKLETYFEEGKKPQTQIKKGFEQPKKKIKLKIPPPPPP
ncbi:MAG: hypothetical protein LBB82_04035 [Treponema sp.]|jgi:hypothetical protein|nr:hypothetical protein [Treponema sp.]